MVVQCDMDQVESHVGPFRDSVNLDARQVHDLRQMYHGHGNHFGRIQWNP
jgi:hypothetical protein